MDQTDLLFGHFIHKEHASRHDSSHWIFSFPDFRCASSSPASVTLKCHTDRVISNLHLLAVETSSCRPFGPCFPSSISTTDYKCNGKTTCTITLRVSTGSCVRSGHTAQIAYQCLPGIEMYQLKCQSVAHHPY